MSTPAPTRTSEKLTSFAGNETATASSVKVSSSLVETGWSRISNSCEHQESHGPLVRKMTLSLSRSPCFGATTASGPGMATSSTSTTRIAAATSYPAISRGGSSQATPSVTGPGALQDTLTSMTNVVAPVTSSTACSPFSASDPCDNPPILTVAPFRKLCAAEVVTVSRGFSPSMLTMVTYPGPTISSREKEVSLASLTIWPLFTLVSHCRTVPDEAGTEELLKETPPTRT
mmetsp:Transcript_30501/g.78904  ORF Transcript_30501/g.78904 Transcript_30501/m.78904 type:complete len:231 (+) Transcript_30501:2459-3151(+)